MKHTLLITGASGYVGSMLIDQFSQREDVERIIALDKTPLPHGLFRNNVEFIQANTADPDWDVRVRSLRPDIVIHAAWQIRELYGRRALEWEWNIEGSDRVFDFALTESSVQRLIHFSTVASYGAFSDNAVDHFFAEDEPLRESPYLYAEEKRASELHLRERLAHAVGKQVFVVRPASITGPKLHADESRFGLQSALSGSYRGERSVLHALVSALLSFMPVTPKWLRQYVHEDDLCNIIAELAFGSHTQAYDVFNLAPPGDVVTGADMARAVGKRAIPVTPWMVRVAFFCLWHLSRGSIPTAPGSWRTYSYPVAVDGSKVTRVLGYTYTFDPKHAFTTKEGRYAATAI